MYIHVDDNPSTFGAENTSNRSCSGSAVMVPSKWCPCITERESPPEGTLNHTPNPRGQRRVGYPENVLVCCNVLLLQSPCVSFPQACDSRTPLKLGGGEMKMQYVNLTPHRTEQQHLPVVIYIYECSVPHLFYGSRFHLEKPAGLKQIPFP